MSPAEPTTTRASRSPRRRVAAVGAGTAGLTAALALAPVAAAATAPATGSSSTAPATPGSGTPSAPASGTTAPSSAGTPSTPATTTTHPAPAGSARNTSAPARHAAAKATPAVAPDYGAQKIRVGVQGKDGAYYPSGTTTAGTVITIAESGPGVTGTVTTECTTDPTTATPGTGSMIATTYCADYPGHNAPFGAPSYQAAPGDTVVVTQKSVNSGLVIDTTSVTVPACTGTPLLLKRAAAAAPADPPVCPAPGDATDVVFTDPGVPPVAVDDTATTGQGTAVSIDVRRNDTPVDPDATLSVSSGAAHGTATVQQPTSGGASGTPTTAAPTSETPTSETPTSGAPTSDGSTSQAPGFVAPGRVALARVAAPAAIAGATTISYTPAAGFSGVDHFTYSLTTPNGVARATVTVRVTAAAPTPTPSTSASATVPPGPSATTGPRVPTANTGTPTGLLLGTGTALVVAGGAVAFVGTRRRGRHGH